MKRYVIERDLPGIGGMNRTHIGFFRNLFKRHTGMTPGEYRDRFSQMSFERGELVPGRQLS